LRLTDLTIKALSAPQSGVAVYFDDTLTGFGVRVSTGGTKSFVLTHGPRRARETIGRVGVVSLSEARAEAKRRLAEYTLGKHRPQEITWDAAKREYLDEQAAKLRLRTHEDYTYYLNRHFRYGATKLSELTSRELTTNLNRLKDRPSSQRYAYGVLRAFMRWSHRKHYVDRNPMERMQMPSPYIPRERILANDELRAVWLSAGDDTFGKIVKVLILSGQRRGEITQLTSGMVGKDMITLPAWLAKNDREHRFPLGNMAREILGTLPKDADACIFPGRGIKTPFDGFSKCKPKLEERCGVSAWTLHDLRRTFASGLAALGVQLPVIERLLNHVSGSFGGIVGVYQRYDYMPEMREAIAKWESHVLTLVQRQTPITDRTMRRRSSEQSPHPSRAVHNLSPQSGYHGANAQVILPA
jgi:integrase